MTISNVVRNFLEGTPPRKVRLLAAGGLLPIPLDEMLLLLVHLARDPDEEIATKARLTLDGWSKPEIASQLKSAHCRTEVHEHFAASTDLSIQEAISSTRK